MGWSALLLFSSFWFCSCTRTDETPADLSDELGIEEKYERGPLRVTLRVDRKELTIAEQIRLSLEVVVDETYEVELPRFGEKLEQFGIVDFHTTQPELVDEGETKTVRTYVLEPFLSGSYTIPPMTLAFWKKDQSEEQKHTLETESVTVEVRSLLPKDVAELEIRDLEPPVALPRSSSGWVLVGLFLLGGGLIGIGVWFWCRRQRPRDRQQVHTVLPHEWAFEQLRQLVSEELAQQGRTKEFYHRLSDILRRYIELRFGLHAPERTTEEFLSELGSDRTLEPKHKDLLKAFLVHCDLVKFAEFQPSTKEVQRAFDGCKEFIVETEPNREPAKA